MSLELGTPGFPDDPLSSGPVFQGLSGDGSHLFFTSGQSTALEATQGTDLYVNAGATGNQLLAAGSNTIDYDLRPELIRVSYDGSTVAYSLPYQIGGTVRGLSSYLVRGGSQRPLAGTGADGYPLTAGVGGMTPDGATRIVGTSAALLPADQDLRVDYYLQDDDTLRLLTPGAAEGAGARDVTFCAVSPDARRILFTTGESLVPEDTDGGYWDVYEATADGVKLRTPGLEGPGSDTTCYGASADLSTVAFTTGVALAIGDTDTNTDLYTLGPDGARRIAAAPHGLTAVRVSDDGARVTFETDRALLASEGSSTFNTYQYARGALRHYPGVGLPVSPDGRTIAYVTTEPLVPEDTDATVDVYEVRDGRARRLSPGPQLDEARIEGASADARRVVFSTAARLSPQDVDDTTDLYAGGSEPQLLSGQGVAQPVPYAVSDDATTVVFDTADALTADDTDSETDLYRAHVSWPAPPPDPVSPAPPQPTPPASLPSTTSRTPSAIIQPPASPSLSVTVARRTTLARLRRRGLVIRIQTTGPATVAARLSLSDSDRRRARLRSRLLGRTESPIGRGTRTLRLRPTASALRGLGHLERTRAAVIVKATDASGRSTTVRRTVTISH